MSDVLTSQDLTKALAEVESKIREGRVAAEAGYISDHSKKLMQEGYKSLKELSQKIAGKLPLSAHSLHLTMGKYAPNGKYKSHLWSAIIPITVRAPSHVTPQLYIFRSNTIFAWGISPSDAAIEHPEFMDAYRSVFRANESEVRKLFSEGFIGRGYDGETELKKVEAFLDSKNMTLARVYAINALPSEDKLYAQIESDLVRMFDLYSRVAAGCMKQDLLSRLNRDKESDIESDDQWFAAWNEWFDRPNDVAGSEVPAYLQGEYGKTWKNLRQLWEVGRKEALKAIEQAVQNDSIPEERIQALLFGSLRRTAMTGGWRSAVKDNFASILKETHTFSKAHPEGCSNSDFATLLGKVQKLADTEAKSFVTRLLCDLQPNHYLPVAKLTIPALKRAAGILGTTPANLKSTDDYEAVCREAKRLAERHPSLPADAKLYVFDHFLYWLENEYSENDGKTWKAAEPRNSEPAKAEPTQGFWKISCGRSGMYSAIHRKSGYISIGWGGQTGVADISKFKSREDLAAAFKRVPGLDSDPDYAAGQCWNIAHDIQVGDFIFGYGSGTVLLVGKVTGPYEAKNVTEWAGPDSPVSPNHRHLRRVEWMKLAPIETTSLPPELKRRLERNQTIIKLTKDEGEEILRAAGIDNGESDDTDAQEVESISLEALCEMTAKPMDFFTTMERRLLEKRQIVLYGPPGTSKTHIAKAFSRYFQNGKGQVENVQFHPSYSYEDFIEGYRPNGSANGAQFSLHSGVFKEFCKRALANQSQRHVIIIDEINRGNLPQIFGELLYLLEYRGEETTLPYSKSPFVIPENVYVIATMNSADRSIAMVDYALRRRFDFFDLSPDAKTLKSYLERTECKVPVQRVVALFEKLNAVVGQELGKHYRVGHTYFMKPNLTEQALKEVWQFSVLPLLEEYFFDNERASESVTFDNLWGKESEAA